MITWILEQEIFVDGHSGLRSAAHAANHDVIEWNDDWWSTGNFPKISSGGVLFHGSLGNAARITSELDWEPGALCDVEAFKCSTWYPGSSDSLLNSEWRVLPAREFVSDAGRVFAEMGGADTVFVRPDSALKPFSGRVVSREGLTLETLDHGFYYEDEELPVIVAPVSEIEAEWRFVASTTGIVCGSSYEADGRTAGAPVESGEVLDFAALVADSIPPPESLYVLDICRTKGRLRLLELNPFSGADLYSCDRSQVVSVAAALFGRS